MNRYEYSLEVELTSKCTLQCPACSRSSTRENASYWDAGHMPLDFVKSLCDNSDYNRYLFVGCYGDVVYHPDFIEICDYFIKADKKLLIHTNGSLRPQKFWDKLSQLDWNPNKHIFCFSIDGLADTNHYYRINAKWDTIMRGVEAMSKSTKRPYMEWKYIKFPYNQHQVEEARQLSVDLGFDNFDIVESMRNAALYKNTEDPSRYVW